MGSLVGCARPVRPLELAVGCGLLTLARPVIALRSPATVQVLKVKDHATDWMVQQGQLRSADNRSNDLANVAADTGRRWQLDSAIATRRSLAREPVVIGILLSPIFVCSSLPFLRVWSIWRVSLGLPQTLYAGLRVVGSMCVVLCLLFVKLLCCLALLTFGLEAGSLSRF